LFFWPGGVAASTSSTADALPAPSSTFSVARSPNATTAIWNWEALSETIETVRVMNGWAYDIRKSKSETPTTMTRSTAEHVRPVQFIVIIAVS